ncbi:DUF3301 domain-containing protein [Alteromonas halophila]|uniref:DUF3301 domain-containing protein n=1 Tax=Alteromonas halophila TaxID=516698 RepID=A0A918MUF2_9ALTE|nr:DUF3301 domain-containing protein [Alteromonas halophila]GGW73111.1 hypothetical protein GCM10007391_00810 [Alteromonas halophila]
MTLGELVLWLSIGFVVFQFWRVRSISEAAHLYLQHYCKTHQLQLLSLARKTTRLTLKTGKPDWYSEFIFEFSSSGDDRYQGTLIMAGRYVTKTDVPVHRIQPDTTH